MGDAGDDGLLTVWTHGLHWCGLEHFPLQYSHSGGCSWRSQHSRCVAPHVDKVTGTRTHLSRHGVRKVPRWRWVMATWWWHWHRHRHRHGPFSRDMWGEEAWMWALIWRRTIVWRLELSLRSTSDYWLPILLLNEWSTGASGVRRRRITGHTGRMSVQGKGLDTELHSQFFFGLLLWLK